jgi:hypothetical protein
VLACVPRLPTKTAAGPVGSRPGKPSSGRAGGGPGASHSPMLGSQPAKGVTLPCFCSWQGAGSLADPRRPSNSKLSRYERAAPTG